MGEVVIDISDAGGLEELGAEHEAMRRILEELPRTTDPFARKDLLLRATRLISSHEDVEASVLGPVIRGRMRGGRELARMLRSRYRTTEQLLAKIERRSVSSPDLPDLLAGVTAQVTTAMREQESSVFPAMRRGELGELDPRLTKARRHATTRPHPHLSHRRGLSHVVRVAAAGIDKFRDRMPPRL